MDIVATRKNKQGFAIVPKVLVLIYVQLIINRYCFSCCLFLFLHFRFVFFFFFCFFLYYLKYFMYFH
uniref:Uncharacterized protein n=1 Tax=Helianthus annuus TaxID=4232 RepID=A0A251UTM6_HELAN